MEIGNKRHGKKSDKETQSPVLKVFKEMIQRENHDPEKANLLKEKQENRKRRQYSGSRSKSDRVNRSCDSSSSEKNRRSVQYKVAVHDQKLKDYNQRSPSLPFQGDKKDSWWVWGDRAKSEDTCSCVSCALKRIISSEYTFIACLSMLFLVTVLVAFMLLFKTVPIAAKKTTGVTKPQAKKARELGSDVLKRKIDVIQRGCKEDGGYDRAWDDTMTRHLSSLTGRHGDDFDDGSYREFNALDESSIRSDSELSSVLDTEKLNEGLSSDRLRNFYKKLIQTDAKIRNMKKSVNEYTQTSNDEYKYNYPDRSKRSLRFGSPKYHYRHDFKKDANDNPVSSENNLAELSRFNIFYPPYTIGNATSKNNQKVKRFSNGTDEPTGFVIEKKQIVVQYKPRDKLRKVPKCSHAPKESKSHEKQLKHPFYKNTQRLDELLDQFLDKNLPEMMVDPFGVDVLFHHKDLKTHKTNVKVEKEKVTKKPLAKMKNKESNKDKISSFAHNRAGDKRVGELDRAYFDMVTSKKKGKTSTSTPPTSNYDVILSVSTIVNPEQRKFTKTMNVLGRTPSLLERVPHIRKLMQVEEEDEEGLGYEDLNEVLKDDTETHDDIDNVRDRKKRTDEYMLDDLKIPNPPTKYNPPGVHNPNWKGPMPLYPDELSSMIKQAALQNVQNYNRIHLPDNTEDMSSEADSLEKDLNDMEYIENYSNRKFDKLAKLAQAYSDYGVLGDKEESARNDKAMDGKNTERRVKLSIKKKKSFKNKIFDRFKKSKDVSEGIRFEIRPTSPSREDKPLDLMKVIEKHVKLSNKNFASTSLPLNTEYVLFSTIQKESLPTDRRDPSNEYQDNGVVITFAKNGRRSLKSVDDDPVKTVENVENQKKQEGKLIIKGISGLNFRKSDNRATIDKDIETEVTNESNFHRHHEPHHHHHNHHDKNTSNTISNELKLKEKALSVNDTNNTCYRNDSVKANDTSNNQTDSVGHTQDNNLISTILNLNTPRNSSDSNMALSDFFMLMSNWFSVMAGFDTGPETNQPNSNIIKLINKSETLNTTPKSDEPNIEFPMYDSDMIENIGHRSRVLMSLENSDKSTVDVSEINTSGNGRNQEITSASSAINSHKEDASTASSTITTTETIFANATPSNPEIKELILTKSDRCVDNKTVVKRNVPEDSNLIFWNDIYDDEYGVKLDPIDDALAEKQNSKSINFMKKSGSWIQDKVKNIANNFRGKDKMNTEDRIYKRRVLRTANYHEDPGNVNTRYNKRSARYEEAVAEDKSTGFAALTAKMKEVCKEAAKAVEETKNVKVRQDEKEDTMTTSLMQQLVRLMTDLIDFQVQQKTCVKLPPDLKEFLVWLTAPNTEHVETHEQKMSYQEGTGFGFDKPEVIDLVTTPSSEKEMNADSRSDCLGTLHSVQDLMQQYDEMTDEDKSKMTGVRDYLENQLQFLNKQLATFDDYKTLHIFEDQNPSYRFRRDLPPKEHNRRYKNNQIMNRRSKRNRFRRRFFKNFGKKHTRTTASIYDGFAMTEVNKFTKDDNEKGANDNADQKEMKNVKRNLKDIYYKALNDAKKSSTFKTTVKDAMEGFDRAEIVRIDN